MGLFDFLKKKNPLPVKSSLYADSSAIPADERQYYQPDDYYTLVTNPGTEFEKHVVLFDERKKTTRPSKNGLYVAEILLLHYCNKYPNPKNGYPAFWWFTYGIRDVGGALRSLESRGFIRMGTAKESLSNLTVAQLQQILSDFNLPTKGKKSELIAILQDSLDESDLVKYIPSLKYTLTDLGKTELQENEYVPYMHKHSGKTTENTMFGPSFNVWSVNQQLSPNNTQAWREIVDAQEASLTQFYTQAKQSRIHVDSELADRLDAQNRQLAEIQAAEAQYKADSDIDALILFWEKLWDNGGLLFKGAHWAFRLPDLYIRKKRYDDALCIIEKLTDPYYSDKKKKYIEKIEAAKDKKK